MNISRSLRIMLGISFIVIIASAGFFFIGCNFTNKNASSPDFALLNSEHSSLHDSGHYLPTRGNATGGNEVLFSETVSGLNSISMQIRLIGAPEGFETQAILYDIDKKEREFSLANLGIKNSLVLANADLSIWGVADFDSIKFSTPIPEGVIVEIWDLDRANRIETAPSLRASSVYRARMDYNGDTYVDSSDIVIFAAWYQLSEPNLDNVSARSREIWASTVLPVLALPTASNDDLNGDGVLDSNDICYFIAWFQVPEKTLANVTARARELWGSVKGSAVVLPAEPQAHPSDLGMSVSGLNTANLYINILGVSPSSTITAFLPITKNGSRTFFSWTKSSVNIIGNGVVLVCAHPEIASVEPFSSIQLSQSLPNGSTLEIYNRDTDELIVRIGTRDNIGPDRPSITVPIQNATGIERNPILVADAFRGNGGNSHTRSDWEVYDVLSGYRVWKSKIDSTSITSVQVNAQKGDFETILYNSVSLSGGENIYEARVRYYDENGLSSPWSEKVRFTTIPYPGSPPDVPALVTPSDSQLEVILNPKLVSSPFFIRNKDEHRATTWEVWNDNGFGNVNNRVWRSENDINNKLQIVINSQNGTFVNGLAGEIKLEPDTWYRARIKHINTSNYESEWSNTVRFKTAKIVIFPDTNLNTVVRMNINKPYGDLYSFDLLGITSLSGNFSVLTGVENLVNLQHLVIDPSMQTYVTLIDSLAPLVALKTFSARSQKISYIPLLSSRMLETVYLDSNNVSDITGFADCSKLTILDLDNNAVRDLSSLVALRSLQNLKLNNNLVNKIDVIANLKSLKSLQLGGNVIEDISSLAGLNNLVDLRLQNNVISDISALAFITDHFKPNINYPDNKLDLSNNLIEDVSPLKNMQDGVLYLQNNLIEELDPFLQSANFKPRKIYLAGNPCLGSAEQRGILSQLGDKTGSTGKGIIIDIEE